MRISNILTSKKLTLSFEVFPPKPLPEKAAANLQPVLRTVSDLAVLRPDFISVTYGAGGGTRVFTSDIARAIEAGGVPALAHLTCVGASVRDIDESIASLKTQKIENVLALRGDLPEGASTIDGFTHASDLIPRLKAAGFCVGGACYPEGHPESPNREIDLLNVKKKVDAGVDFLTTQMFFDNDMLYSFLYRLQACGVHVPVLAGIMPITNAAQVKRMVSLSNAYIPRKLLAIVDRFRDKPDALYQAGISYAIDQIIDLISNGLRGIHIYTMNKARIATAIVSALDKVIEAAND
jgi:methylenetetrahydrofolate reductase (NADPH)